MLEKKLKFRFFLWLILAALTGWLLYLAVVPMGRISYIYDFSEPSYFIQKLTPAERLGSSTEGAQIITGDPVYFALRTPRAFNTARLTVKFKNPDNFPVIEAGVLADKKIWRYQNQPLENLVIDSRLDKWPTLRSGGTVLLQRKKNYDTFSDFLKKPPPPDEIALYNYQWKKKYLLPDYQKSAQGTIITNPLRGPLMIYTYVKDETLNFSFDFFDLNKNKDADPVELKLFDGDRLIAIQTLPDDGIVGEADKPSASRNVNIKKEALSEGVYRLELVAGDDIVTKRIVSAQGKISFISKIWLAEGGSDNLFLYTDSQEVSAQTINPAKLQTISVAGKPLNLSETYRQFAVTTGADRSEIHLKRNDVMLAGDGVFAFKQEALLNPNLTQAIGGLDLDKKGINYILAGYQPPEKDGEWQIASAEFDLTKAYREFYKYNFLLSIPGLRAEDKSGKKVMIKEIKIELSGTTLWQKIRNIYYEN